MQTIGLYECDQDGAEKLKQIMHKAQLAQAEQPYGETAAGIGEAVARWIAQDAIMKEVR